MVNRIVCACVVWAALAVPASAHALVFPFYEPPERLDAVADAIVALDFDGDRRPDIAGVSRATGAVTLVLNDGLGFDEAQTRSLTPGATGAVAVAGGDLDGDGRDELLVTLADSGSLQVYPGRADGELGAPQAHVLRPEATAPSTGVAAADVDGDGDRDVVAAFGPSATVLVNDGRGGLTPVTGALTIPAVHELQLVRLAGDDDPDLIALSADALTVLPGAAAAGFGAPETHRLPFAGADLATADVDGDGRLDVGVTYGRKDEFSPAPSLFSGTPAGGLSPLAHTAIEADALVLADFDGDGVTDRYASHRAAAFAHGAPHGFGAFNWGASEIAQRDQALAAADFDGDGKLDVASAEAGSGAVSVRLFTGPQLVPSDANTWFGKVPMGGGGSMIAVAVRNEGGGVARNLELVTEGDSADFEVDAKRCEGAVLRIEEVCWLDVHFRPKAVGSRSVDLGVFAEDSGLAWFVTLDGEGLERRPVPGPAPGGPRVLLPPPPVAPSAPRPPRPAPAKAVRPGVPAFARPTLAGVRRSGLRFSQVVGTAEPLTWTLEHRGTVLARAGRTVAVGRVSVTLKLTAAGKRVLARRKPASLTLRTKGALERVTTVRIRRG